MVKMVGVAFVVVLCCVLWFALPVEALEPHGRYGEGWPEGRVPAKESSSCPQCGHHQYAESVERQRMRKPQESFRGGAGRKVCRSRRSWKRGRPGSCWGFMKRWKSEPVSEQRVLRLIARQLNAEPRRARKARIAKKWRNEERQMKRMKHLMTRKLGASPILQHFMQQMRVVSLIDELVPGHEARTISHGEAVVALMASLLCGGRALYRMEQ
jgi:hypothetical protein